MIKRISASLVVILLVSVFACAADVIEITPEDDTYTTQSESVVFNVTVPMSLPIYVSSDGAVEVAKDAVIVNNSTHPVKVTNIEIIPENGWELVDPLLDLDNLYPGGKGFQLEILGCRIDLTGAHQDVSIPAIASGETLEIDYSASIQTQTDRISESIASISFTIDWANPEQVYSVVTIPELPEEEQKKEEPIIEAPEEGPSAVPEEVPSAVPEVSTGEANPSDTPVETPTEVPEKTPSAAPEETPSTGVIETDQPSSDSPSELPLETPDNSDNIEIKASENTQLNAETSDAQIDSQDMVEQTQNDGVTQ